MVRLSQARLNAFAEIFRGVAQVFFASVFVEPIVAGKTTWIVLLAGITLALGSWFLSILLTKHI